MRSVTRTALLGALLLLVCSGSRLTAQEKASTEKPDTMVLSGASFGSVRFAHDTHEKYTLCADCHHAARGEKPLASEYQKCSECHEKTAAAPMKTSIRDAFHDAKARSGTCMDCHVARAVKRNDVPVTCKGCHIR